MPSFPLARFRAWMTGHKETADRICGRELFVLTEGPRQFGKHVDWNYGEKIDIKIPWELSRFQFLPTLARAYEIHHDEKYAESAREYITDWIAKNPAGRGMHWRIAMEAAIRTCNWALTWQFLQHAPSWKDASFQKNLLSSLQLHGNFIFTNLENNETPRSKLRDIFTHGNLTSVRQAAGYFSRFSGGSFMRAHSASASKANNPAPPVVSRSELTNKPFTTNHYVADLAGLFFLGTLFPDMAGAAEWKNFAHAELEKEMMRQVYEDGVFYEASIPYHRLACELFGYCALLARENNADFSPDFFGRLEKMFEFVVAYTKPNGLAPQIGDGDDGRLFLLEDYFGWDPCDHRHLFNLAATLFPVNTNFVQAEGKGRSKNTDASAPAEKSRGFEKSGIYILRNGDFYCAVDCGPNGQNGNGGHCHNDTLSFELSVGGQDFIIDPGTYMYTGNPAERRRFRGTRMHNTVMVDGKEQNRFRLLRLFGVKNDCVPKINRWESNEKSDTLDVQHSGYERLLSPLTHRRTFQRINMLAWQYVVTDYFTGKGHHKLQWNFHFAPHTTISMKNENTYLLDKNGVRITLEIPAELHPRAYIRWDFVSPRYGVKIEAPVLTIKKTVLLDSHEHSFRFTILPA